VLRHPGHGRETAFSPAGQRPQRHDIFCPNQCAREAIMTANDDQILASLIQTIRLTVNEDWIEDFPITRETRFHDDLELESIEFVRIADAVQARFGKTIDIAGFLSGRSIQELIALCVGDLADFIAVAA
jgi:acyl carrier protein